MTPEQIVAHAKQADIWQPLGLPSDWDSGDYVATSHQLQTFAKLVRNATLEEAAVCAEYENAADWSISGQIAQQIRSLKS